MEHSHHEHEAQPEAHAHDEHNHGGDEMHDHPMEMEHSHHEEHHHGACSQEDSSHQEAGHSEHSGHDHTDHSGHEEMFRQKFWVSLALSIPVLLYSEPVQNWLRFSMPSFTGSKWIVPIFSVVVFIYGGLPFLDMARPELKSKKPGMMALISLAISVAFIYSLATTLFKFGENFYWELVTLIVIMLLGHWLEMRSVRQASGALNELARLMPDTAERILHHNETEIVPVDQLRKDDIVLVRPGASIPADGVIDEGESELNEAMITGESKPVEKIPGSSVIAGTINGDGSLRIRITATGDETALAGIMRLVAEAQNSKSQTQLLADKAAGWLFYIALSVAAITAVLWIIATGWNIEVLKRVVTVLVIACPHALGLAVPLVVAISTSLGAKNGILVRDRLSLENARNLDIIVFDKTGTLTEGSFGIVDSAYVSSWVPEEALALIAGLEGDSEHLIARGIRNKADELGITPADVKNFEALKGYGIRATANGKIAHVGGPRMLEMLNIDLPNTLAELTERSNEKGYTVIYLIVDESPVAAFGLADLIRPEAKQTIEQLKRLGIESVMLTGDSIAVARNVASELGIQRYFAEVVPEDKDNKIQELQKEGKRVAMVGDGVNDAPALTRADIGIAIGSGTDVAVESAGLILVKSNPLDVVNIVALSKATYAKMIQNLIWATGYNIIALPLAAGILAPWGILLSPAVGALFMSLSTIIVAINAQLLRRLRFT